MKGHDMATDARTLRFEAVRVALGELLDGSEYSTHLAPNDAMEPVLEIQSKGFAWLIGMMDEPIWGYDLEHDDHAERSWAHVKEVSLGMAEDTPAHIVAGALFEAVLRDRAELDALEAVPAAS